MRFLIRNRDSRYSAPSMRSSAPKGDPDRQAVEWTQRSEEFVKRAAFVVVAVRAVHDKRTDDRAFADLLPTVMAAADDDRPYVRKGASWALRQIGRRSDRLRTRVLDDSRRLVERLVIGRGQRRGAARDLVLAADSTARSVAKAFSMRRMRVSDFFALSIARTCSNLRL
jgi:DNA alkylation repair enzyme